MAIEQITPTRRKILATLAVAPVAGLPAVAGAVVGNDPGLAAIAEYEQLHAAAEAAWQASCDADETFAAARDALGVVTFNGQKIQGLKHLYILAEKSRSVVWTKEELEDTIAQMRRGWARQQSKAATLDIEYREARAALEALLPAYQKAEEDSGIEAAQKAAKLAQEEEDDAQRAMFETTPTSRAGAIALLRHAADHIDEIGLNDTLLEDVFTDAIRNAVAVLERGA